MTDLINSFSLPWWLWLCLGGLLTSLLINKEFRDGTDSFLARLFDLKPKKRE